MKTRAEIDLCGDADDSLIDSLITGDNEYSQFMATTCSACIKIV